MARPRLHDRRHRLRSVRPADADGLDAVTLAAVARELALTTTALYRCRHQTGADRGHDRCHNRLAPRVPAAPGKPMRARGRWPRRTLPRPPVARRRPAGGDASAAPAVCLARRPRLRGRRHPGGTWHPDAPGVDAPVLGCSSMRSFAGMSTSASIRPRPRLAPSKGSHRHPRLAARLARDWSDTERELTHAIDVVSPARRRRPQPEEGARRQAPDEGGVARRVRR